MVKLEEPDSLQSVKRRFKENEIPVRKAGIFSCQCYNPTTMKEGYPGGSVEKMTQEKIRGGLERIFTQKWVLEESYSDQNRNNSYVFSRVDRNGRRQEKTVTYFEAGPDMAVGEEAMIGPFGYIRKIEN